MLVSVILLSGNRIAASHLQQGVGEGAGEQQRHQVLEHCAAPGEQSLTLAGVRIRPVQGAPVLHRHVTLGHRYQARQAAFTGQQVVVAQEFARSADRVTDAKQLPLLVIQKTHVDAVGQFCRRVGQSLNPVDCFDRVAPCLGILRREPIQPPRQFRR